MDIFLFDGIILKFKAELSSWIKANSSSLEMALWNELPVPHPAVQVDYWLVKFIEATN